MNRNQLFNTFLFAFLLLAFGTTANGQNEKATDAATYETVVLKGDIASPKKEMKGTIGATKVSVVYGSPSVKGREVWGGLVPFGKVWRTGANDATSIEFSGDVEIEGKKLAAGKYGLFTIPGEKEWTIIFNKTAEQWGAYNYDASKDVLRVTVPSKVVSNASETMEFMLDGSALVLHWDRLAVPVRIKG